MLCWPPPGMNIRLARFRMSFRHGSGWAATPRCPARKARNRPRRLPADEATTHRTARNTSTPASGIDMTAWFLLNEKALRRKPRGWSSAKFRRRASVVTLACEKIFSCQDGIAAGTIPHRHRSSIDQETAEVVAPAKVTFLVSGLEHPSILHDDGQVSVEAHLPQQSFGRGREQFAGLDLAPQLDQDMFVGAAAVGLGS